MTDARRLWAVVLSGGAGRRLRPLVHQALGEDRPKQYVSLLGPRSLLRQTLDRVALLCSTSRTVVVTVRAHAGYIAEEFTHRADPPYLLAQPCDRGTAAGLLYPAHWIAWRDPEATVAIFPSGHFVLGEATFMAHVDEVARSVDRHPDRVVVLAAQPTSPEGGYDWIEPGSPTDGHGGVVAAVRQFWEQPPEARVQMCLASGGLWSTGIVVARAATLVKLGADALPEMSRRLAGIQRFLDRDEEPAAVHQAYALMAPASFARQVLEPYPERLGVSRLPRVTWYDLGTPRRVLDVLSRMRVRPAWADVVERPAATDLAPAADAPARPAPSR